MRPYRLVIALALVALDVSALSAQSNGVREVSGSGRSLIPLTTKLRYTTMIMLPEQEEILDVVCGDRDFWVISATQNIAHVKPAKEGAATNLNLVTTSGTVYSFLLTATFPLVTPEASADGPTRITSHVADGGYFDNTGIYIAMLGTGEILNVLPEGRRAIFIDIYSTSEQESTAEARRLSLRPEHPSPSAGWLEPIRAVFSTRREHERILTALMSGVVRQMARLDEKDLVTFRFPLYGIPGSWELTRRELDTLDGYTAEAEFKGRVACVCAALQAKSDCETRFDEAIHFP